MKGKLYFNERQRVTQWWVWAIVIGLNILVLLFLYFQVIQGEPIGNNPVSDTGLYIIAIFIFILSIFFLYFYRLDTEIREEGIYVRVSPFHWNFVFYSWDEIEESYVRKYKPLLEFGGWGLRGWGDNKAFTARGEFGIQLILKNGKKRLVGTSRPQDAEDALVELGKIELEGNFAKQVKQYIKYRPDYPPILFEYLYAHCNKFENAWDCGCGNGKVALPLAEKFPIVYGTDISNQLLKYAPSHPNIIYRVGKAEEIRIDRQFDLITVAQSIHWFKFDPFYENIRRHLKPDGILAVFGYDLPKIDENCDPLAEKLFYDILEDYWDPAIEHIISKYKTIPFPFKEVHTPEFTNQRWWTLEDITGYFRSWSAVQNYIDHTGEDPIDLIREDLRKAWGDNEHKPIQFRIFLRLGKQE